MPLGHFAVLLGGVIAAAGLTVALGALLMPEGRTAPAVMAGALAGAMFLRLLAGRRRNGR